MSNTLTFAIDIQLDLPPDTAVLTPAVLTPADLAELETFAQHTLTQQRIAPPAALTILLTDDDQLQQLNRDYRGYDQTTDVLSFADGSDLPDIGLYLGDIAISVPQAQRQADAGGHPLLAELRLLTVHGVLHLLGHDHGDPDEKERMWQAQADILADTDTPLPDSNE